MANRPVDEPIRVALYARVSTRDKDQDPELQLDAMRDYVRARGWRSVEYVDTAAAGDLAHRVAWARLLADVAQRRVDRVLVWKLDRAFRSTLHALATLRDLDHAGVGFASLTQPELDTTSPTGRLVFTILAAVARWSAS
jgi:DNA invertase Pin-like site-specific DNA recombinase